MPHNTRNGVRVKEMKENAPCLATALSQPDLSVAFSEGMAKDWRCQNEQTRVDFQLPSVVEYQRQVRALAHLAATVECIQLGRRRGGHLNSVLRRSGCTLSFARTHNALQYLRRKKR